MIERIFVGLGSNLGDSEAYLAQAMVHLLGLSARTPRCSRFYRTKAWGDTQQPDFTNAVAELYFLGEPLDLLRALLAIEQTFGRQRARRWGPRTLDLDLLAFGERRVADNELTLPHPMLAERAFVLVPWAEIAPEFHVVGLGSVAALCRQCSDADSVVLLGSSTTKVALY